MKHRAPTIALLALAVVMGAAACASAFRVVNGIGSATANGHAFCNSPATASAGQIMFFDGTKDCWGESSYVTVPGDGSTLTSLPLFPVAGSGWFQVEGSAFALGNAGYTTAIAGSHWISFFDITNLPAGDATSSTPDSHAEFSVSSAGNLITNSVTIGGSSGHKITTAPISTFSSYYAGPATATTSVGQLGAFYPDHALTVLRWGVFYAVKPVGCTTYATFKLYVNNLAQAPTLTDSSGNFGGYSGVTGTPTDTGNIPIEAVVSTAAAGCSTNASGYNIWVEYETN